MTTKRYFYEYAEVRCGAVHSWVTVGWMTAADAARYFAGTDPSTYRKHG